MLLAFTNTVPCVRAATSAQTDDFGNTVGQNRAQLDFEAVFVPPTTQVGSRLVDGAVSDITVTKPTLYVEGRPDLRSGDKITVDGVSGYEVDGDPAVFNHPWLPWEAPLVVELRRTAGG